MEVFDPEKLYRLVANSGMSVAGFCRAARISKQTYYTLIQPTGQNQDSHLSVLARMALALRVKVSAFLTEVRP